MHYSFTLIFCISDSSHIGLFASECGVQYVVYVCTT